MYHRPRPGTAVAAHLNYSFPSGHAFFATSIYGLIVAAAWQGMDRKYRWMAAVVYTLLVLLTGLSRVYLGMHFASDVLAGFVSGVVWFCVCGYVPLSKKVPPSV